MDVSGFFTLLRLAEKVTRKLRELAINRPIFEDEVKIVTTNLVQGAKSLKTAGKNLKTILSENIESELGRYIRKQEASITEGQQAISRTMKRLCHEIQSIGSWWIVISMWKWKIIKPFIEHLQHHIQFMALIMLLLQSTLELDGLARYVASHGIQNFPFQSRLKTLQRSMRDYRRQIEKLNEAEKLREGQAQEGGITLAWQRYMRESMDMLRTLKKDYTPPDEVFRMSPSTSVSISPVPPSTSASTSSSSGSSDSSSASSDSSSGSSDSFPPPPCCSSSNSSLSGPVSVPISSPQSRSRHRPVSVVSNSHPRSPSPAAIQTSEQQKGENFFTIDSRYSQDVSSWYAETGDPFQPTRNVKSQINTKIPFNIISLYKAQELDLSIEDLEFDDPHKIGYVHSNQRTSDWNLVGKTDVKFYLDSRAHTKPKKLSLFVVHAHLNPPVILGQLFLRQSRRNSGAQ